MRKLITFAILLISSFSSFSQNLDSALKPLNRKINDLQSEISFIKSEITTLNTKLNAAYDSIDTLKKSLKENSEAINNTSSQLGIKITQSGEKITEVSDSLSKNSLYGIIGVLLAILVSGILYWLLSKRQQNDKSEIDGKLENKTSNLKTDIISEIEKTKKELLQENIKLDMKLIEVLENQIKENKPIEVVQNSDEHSKIDHSIPLKVADEITRINAYANTLDPNSQDAKALKSSVKRLINTFKASQYEIIDLLGQKYDDGMKVSVISYIPDEKIQKGEEVISRIIKPLVKYKGEQIQAAQVDVSIAV